MITQEPDFLFGQNLQKSASRIGFIVIQMEGKMINIKLKELKEKANLNIKEISDRSGVPYSTVQKIFSGETENPNSDAVYHIVKALGFKVEDLYEEVQNKKMDSVDLFKILEIQSKVNEQYINSLKRDKRVLIIMLSVVILFFLAMTALDISNGGNGFIHY